MWPIVPLLANSSLVNTVARRSIEQLHELDLPARPALSAYCRLARLGGESHRPVAEAAQDVVVWAQSAGLGSYPEIAATQAFAETLKVTLAKEESALRAAQARKGESLTRKGTDLTWHQVDPSSLSEALSEQIPHAPRTALAQFEEAPAKELKGITFVELSGLLTSFLESLPLSDRPRLTSVVEHWGAMNDSFNKVKVLALLDSLLEDGDMKEPVLIQAVGESCRRLLNADFLTLLAHRAHRDELTLLLQGKWAPSSHKLDAILGAAAEHLHELGSDALFSLASRTAALLNASDLAAVAQDFITRTVAEAPALGDPGEVPARFIPGAFTLALGHPRQALRWRGVYAVVYALVDSHEPGIFLSPFLDALDNTDSPRWLSVREWLAFALEHVALRKPVVLRNVVGRLIPHAISRELPHAKIRHHVKQALLAIEQSFPGSLSADDLARVEQVNRPIAIVQERPVPASFGWRDLEDLRGNEDQGRITPDFTDTVRYWYKPLAQCFAGEDVLRTVAQRATDWMTRLGVTRSAVEAENQQVGDRYKWKETNNSTGSQPQVELLRLYGERHGLYLAAGELIDSVPVLETRGEEGAGNKWDEWTPYKLRGADPALPARLIDAPPPVADNYGVFSSQVDTWRKKEEPYAFSRELEVPDEPDWIIVAGNRDGFEYDRSFSSTVASALVSPVTARALARLLESGSRVAFLPSIELRYDYIIPELEKMEEAACRCEAVQGEEHEAGDGRFVLKAWNVWFYQEASLHDFDPWWPKGGRNYVLPALEVVRHFGWTWHPTELLWRDAVGQCVARCDLWHRTDGEGDRSSMGFRLVMRRDVVSAYVREVDLDVIFAVRLARQSQSGYRFGSNEEEYDPGTTRCFLWSDLSRPIAAGESDCHGKIAQA